MGTYNRLKALIACSRCNKRSEMVIDLYFGRKDLIDYKIGVTYEWALRKTTERGGRPDGGNTDGEGYAECPVCHRDFYVRVKVRRDVIREVEPDPHKKPHIPD